jgi:hypothetical protein
MPQKAVRVLRCDERLRVRVCVDVICGLIRFDVELV